MEREKWHLRNKLKLENGTVSGTSSGRPISNIQPNTVEQLEKECRILKERIKELTDRLEKESNEHLMLEIAELKRHNTALEAVSQVSIFVTFYFYNKYMIYYKCMFYYRVIRV